ncbi:MULTISPECIES: 4-hydroxy-3-methylbut-2-enyl diphosphate reductase [unclassified Fusobacterium]|uniref:4-hydroxy-3-methylbut-2-enyl diphosphate reductase n=1 Tax=Fusobacterium sp. TaxID=68766 RepID=UPI0025BA88DD|nr:4-hydroxy-3-methylbut-2-enyl diphosphate reductase [Fusobacterium sp.]
MEIIRAKHMGFCFGVSGAINICNKISEDESNFGKRTYILGMLVHNEHVVKNLEEQGFKIVEESAILEGRDELQEGDIVIIRAHGTSEKIFQILKDKKVEIHDATCVFVTQIRKTLVEMEKKGYDILFIGDKNHPEVKGIVSFGKRVTICNDLEELLSITLDPNKKYCLLTQTTLNKKKLEKIKNYIKENYSNVEILDKVCGATQVRQEAVEELAQIVDLLIVIGGKTSSNTKKLYDIATSYNPNTYLIQDETDLKKEWFQGKEKIGITAGASTPEEIVIKIENQIRGIH